MSQEVERMFSRIAPDYDRANSVLSFGVHRSWRRAAVKAAKVPRGGHCLDVATGTGDLAIALQRKTGNEGSVAGLDFSRPMLVEGQRKLVDLNEPVTLIQGDALRLPFADQRFDVATIAFGIRNVDDPRRGVEEMARVVKDGGRVVVLEFGQPTGVMSAPYRFYSRHVMPRVGGLLTGDRDAYEYLPETAARFPSGDAFGKIMQETGRFSDVQWRTLTGGIAYLYVGVCSSSWSS